MFVLVSVSTTDVRENLEVKYRGRVYKVPSALVFTLGMLKMEAK
jgi:hypothetical protein